jgi:FdhE protein
MNRAVSSEINRLEKAFKTIEGDTPFLKGVSNAFRKVAISRVVLKARLSRCPNGLLSLRQLSRLAEGRPLLTDQMIASLVDPWGETVESAMLPLAEAFPSIKVEVLRLRDALDAGEIDLGYSVGALVGDDKDVVIDIAVRTSVRPIVLKFTLGQVLKPFVEERTRGLRRLVSHLSWHRGHCPICGAFPELSLLRGRDGDRWLRCSLCGCQWRLDCMVCPNCGHEGGTKECMCVVGLEHKWVEFCSDCHRYIVAIDLVDQTEEITDVAAIGMVHLDLIAQQRGFLPTADCAWNGCSESLISETHSVGLPCRHFLHPVTRKSRVSQVIN